MNKENKNGIMKRGRADIAAAVALAILSACAGLIPIPVQTQPQKPETSFVDALRGLLTDRAQPNLGAPAQPQVEPARAPESYPPVIWPASGAGDFPPYWYLPDVMWPPPRIEEAMAPLPGWLDGQALALGLSVTLKAGDDLLDRHPRPVVLERAYWLLRPVYGTRTQVGENGR